MKILVIGNGGREHALAWKLKQSARVTEVIVAPGNAGTALEPGVRNVPVALDDLDGLLALAQSEMVELTVVGPEAPLVAGVVDRFQAAGLRCFGPSKKAAQLEGSKAFAKNFLARHAIPTAQYEVFTALEAALAYVRQRGVPIVIKADGLAAGKGVVVAQSLIEAEQALNDMLGAHALGQAGARVVIEEFLDGEEVSYIVISDGKHAGAFATSQDHKRRDDGDRGPNTGGMGAYSPAPLVTPVLDARILQTIIEPTLKGMAADGAPFVGFLYAGLMIVNGQPKVIEFNARLGDPEAQLLLLRLRSDLVDAIEAALDGRVDQAVLAWNDSPALGVVLAAAGYPANPRRGDAILGLDRDFDPSVKIFHAGTRLDHGKVVTSGGRVLTVCARGSDLKQAQTQAYEALKNIELKDGFFRRDIGYRAFGVKPDGS